VESHELTVDEERARVTVTFTVVEGPQFRVGTIEVTGASVLPEIEVRRQIKLKPRDEFSRSKLRESVEGTTRLYSSIGKASADVNPVLRQNTVERTVDINFEIVEGPDVFVERINITGNVRSQEKILRREIPFDEGDLFTSSKLDRARQRLTNLGFFQEVRASTAPGADKTRIVVNIEVIEKPTGVFSLGGGFSSVDSFVGTIDLSQRNFLGRGWEVSLRFRGGSVAQQGILSFTEPWLFDTPTTAGFDLFDTRRDYDDFEYESLGLNLRMSRPFLDYARWFLTYRLTQDTTSNVSDSAQLTLQSEEGTFVTSAITASVNRDTRDSPLNPTKGTLTVLASEFAGLGGDSKWVKFSGSVVHFIPIWFGHILAGRAEGAYIIGWGGVEVPLFERFFLGGPSSIRSFKFRELSPEDEFGVKTGGDIMLLGNLEYLIPLPFDVRAGFFFDIGNVYGFGVKFNPLNTREAAGVTFRWNSPFGPIRLDYGINLDRKSGEKFGNFHFSAGSPF
jgi:outer membrane protein insertion porin family